MTDQTPALLVQRAPWTRAEMMSRFPWLAARLSNMYGVTLLRTFSNSKEHLFIFADNLVHKTFLCFSLFINIKTVKKIEGSFIELENSFSNKLAQHWHNNLIISTCLPIDKSFMNSSCESLNLRFVNKFTFKVCPNSIAKGIKHTQDHNSERNLSSMLQINEGLIVLLFWNIWRKRNITLVKGALRIPSLQTVKFKKILQLQMKLHNITMYLCREDLNLTMPKYFKPVILFKDSSCC